MKSVLPGAALLLLCSFAPLRAQNAPAPESAGQAEAPAPDAAPPAPDAAQTTPDAAQPAPDVSAVPPSLRLQQRNALPPGQQRKLERNRRNRERMEARLRDLMGGMGFADPDVQTEIIEHIAGEERAMAPVRTRARALLSALQNPRTPPDRVNAALAELREVLEADRLRRKEAQIVLDDKIGYSRQPRLEAFLILLGVLGDGPAFVLLHSPPPAALPGVQAPGAAPPVQAPAYDAPPPTAHDGPMPDTNPPTPDDVPATLPEEKR